MAPKPLLPPQIISLLPASPFPNHSEADGSDSSNGSHTSASDTSLVPDINIQTVNAKGTNAKGVGTLKATNNRSHGIANIRERWVQEFLQARSLSPNSEKAYRQDLARFMAWTDRAWADITGRQVTQFKTHLMQEQLAPATINRVLSTLKNFYAWMVDADYVPKDPTKAIHLLTLEEPEAQDLSQLEVAQIYQTVTGGKFPERDLAIISILLHGLRAAEASNLNIGDYDGTRLHIRKAKADSKRYGPLNALARTHLEGYFQWRQERGDALKEDDPLFISCSNRSYGQRLSYKGIWEVVNAIARVTRIDLHAHRFRHTFATDLVLKGMDSYHVMTLTRHKSTKSFRRYTKRADQVAAEQAFYGAIGEDVPKLSTQPTLDS
jgi:integrase/recombinase XerD